MGLHDQKKYGCQNGEACDCVFENLVGPESCVRSAPGEFGGNAVAAEKIYMGDEQSYDRARQNTGVKGEETSQCMMAIFRAANYDFLQLWADAGDDRDKVGGDFGCPESFLVPWKQVAGQGKG